jgi:hypothetical protein
VQDYWLTIIDSSDASISLCSAYSRITIRNTTLSSFVKAMRRDLDTDRDAVNAANGLLLRTASLVPSRINLQ